MAMKVKTKAGKAIRGRGTVRISKDGKVVRIELYRVVDGVDETTVYNLKRDDAPAGLKSGVYSISLSEDGSKVLGFYPYDGMFTVKALGVNARDGERPAPQDKENKYGPYQQFTVLHEIVGNEFAGCQVPDFVRYLFDGEDGETVITKQYKPGKYQSKHAAKLYDLLTRTGVLDERDNQPYSSIPWDEDDGNILPEVHKRMVTKAKSGHRYQIVISDGFVIKYSPVSQFEETDLTDDEEAEDDDVTKPDVADVPEEEFEF